MDWERITITLERIAYETLKGATGRDFTTAASDLAQDAVIKLMERGVTTEDDAFKLGAKIVTDLSLNYRRDEIRRRELEEEISAKNLVHFQDTDGAASYPDPLDILLAEERMDQFIALSPLLAATAELHYIQGLEVSAIAEMQGVTEDVIYKRLQRARDFVTGEANG